VTPTTFRHFEYKDGHVTVALNFNPDSNTVCYTAAFCSPKDVFSRTHGRDLALKRMTFFTAEETPEYRLQTLVAKGKAGVLPMHEEGHRQTIDIVCAMSVTSAQAPRWCKSP
jgi:hypothetical protein